MKTKERNTKKASKRSKKEFDAVKFMREERNKISKEIKNLSPEEIVKYFEQKDKKDYSKSNS